MKKIVPYYNMVKINVDWIDLKRINSMDVLTVLYLWLKEIVTYSKIKPIHLFIDIKGNGNLEEA